MAGGLLGDLFGGFTPMNAQGVQAPMGFMDTLGENRNSLIGLGLGLMGGSREDPYGRALGGFAQGAQADFNRKNANITGDIKEYQYARSQGFKGSYEDWKRQQANLRPHGYGLNPQWYQYKDPDTGETKWGMAQVSGGGGVNPLQAPGGGVWAPPNTQIQTPQGVFLTPKNQAPGYDRPTTSATDADGRPVVPEGPSQPPGGVPGAYIPKEYIGTEEQKGIGSEFGKDYVKIQRDSNVAVRRLGTLQQMERLSPDAYQGAAAPAVQYGRSLLSTFGVDAGKVPAGEVFTQLSNKMVLESTGGSLGNQISNADRDFIAATVPNISNTQQGRMEMIGMGKKLAQREIDVARMAREYRARNGNMNGFSEAVADYAEKNPLFPRVSQAPSGERGPPANAIQFLRQNPSRAREFDAKYGPGAAARYLNSM